MSKIYKTSSITFKTSELLKKKFQLACGTLNMSQVIETYIHNYVRDYEINFGVIPVNPNKAETIDLIKRFHGISIDERQYRRILDSSTPRYGHFRSLDDQQIANIEEHIKDSTD